MDYEYELYHHGIKGMKWGVRRTATQLGHVVTNTPRKINQSITRRKEKAAEIARERARKKVIKSRSAKELYKHADLFSDEELVRMRDRLALEQKVKDLSAQSSVGARIIRSMAQTSDILGKSASAADNGIKLYNNVARVLNAKNPDKKPLTIIGEKKEKKDEEKISIKTTRKFLDEHGNEMTEETTRKVRTGEWKPANEKNYSTGDIRKGYETMSKAASNNQLLLPGPTKTVKSTKKKKKRR